MNGNIYSVYFVCEVEVIAKDKNEAQRFAKALINDENIERAAVLYTGEVAPYCGRDEEMER